MMTRANIHLRLAVPEDVPVLRALIEASVRGLQTQDYTQAQMEGALKTVFGVDSQLIADGTYIVAEAESGAFESTGAKNSQTAWMIIGCGGLGKRKTPFRRHHSERRAQRRPHPFSASGKNLPFFLPTPLRRPHRRTL